MKNGTKSRKHSDHSSWEIFQAEKNRSIKIKYVGVLQL